MQLLALSERVTDCEDAIVWQSYDVARPCLIDCALALCHELCWGGETYGFAQTHMQIGLIAHKFTRANLAESNAGAVVGVDVGCDLKDETSELGL